MRQAALSGTSSNTMLSGELEALLARVRRGDGLNLEEQESVLLAALAAYAANYNLQSWADEP